MIIVKCNAAMKEKDLLNLYFNLAAMAKTGLVLLPNFCELLDEVHDDLNVIVVGEKGNSK